jgi:transcriptional regulator with XRE-family HTH domain
VPSDDATPGDLLAQGDGADPHAVGAAFGRRFRELRVERGISQDDLARETGLHATVIGRYERGVREPRVAMILRLAKGLGVKPGELVDGLTREEA